jgi:rod shape-determining protein MreC
MLASRTARRGIIAYVALLAISLLLLAFSASAPIAELRNGVGFALSPIQNALRQGTKGVTSFLSTFGEVDRLRQQNDDLTTQVAQLQDENQRLQTLATQNRELSALLDVRSAFDYQTVAAEVSSRRTTEQERVISLDRGTDAGIAVDDPVIAAGGALVGQVVEVGPNYSRVLLITDTRMFVAGLLEGSRAVGDVHGQGERPLEMSNIPATDVVALGEPVVTAGIELDQGIRSPYPKGLLIGTIVNVERSPDQLFQTALLQWTAPLDRIEYVLVVINYEGGLPELSPAPSGSPGPGATTSPTSPVSTRSARPTVTAIPATPQGSVAPTP